MELAIRNLALSTTLTLCAAEGYAEINRLQNFREANGVTPAGVSMA